MFVRILVTFESPYAPASTEEHWWEAIVIARNGDMLTLRFRDYPKLPKFSRHRAAVALISAVAP